MFVSETVLAIATMLFGIIVIVGMFAFGLRIYDRRLGDWSHRSIKSLLYWLEKTNQRPTFDWRSYWEAWDEVFRLRNKFWELFGQVALSVVVSVIVAVLLLTRTINADAGLPILSAIVAFVVGKGIDGRGRGSTGSPTTPTDTDT